MNDQDTRPFPPISAEGVTEIRTEEESPAEDPSAYQITKHLCPLCGHEIGGGKYCKHCGASATLAEDRIIDYRNLPEIYGPMPRQAEIKCRGCGYRWSESNWDWLDQYSDPATLVFCPECGKLNKVKPDEWKPRF